jgi:C4-dicarboxylate-specific signal transduction histidine kinase
MGVPPEAASRAFDPFYSTRQGGRGTGIGLFHRRRGSPRARDLCVLEPREAGGTRASMRLRLA